MRSVVANGPPSSSSPSRTYLEKPAGKERRQGERYQLELGVQYRILRRGGGGIAGIGRSRNISRKGVYVVSEHAGEMRAGVRLQAVLEWPILLDGTTGLQVKTEGRVVRSEKDGFAILFQKYEFRTAKRRRTSLQFHATSQHTEAASC